MHLDHDLCYKASASRDPRFDGRFFVAVLTTGIYCRPICPAPLPKRENMRFYVTAAAARQAGFRPCLRCRPEASPGTPEWQGGPAVVARALQLIEQGALEEGNLTDLSKRLHTGARQLRRLFVEHLGAPPIRVAQTRRLHFAKKLINETTLPMTRIAFASGYSSVRRFNDAIRKSYDRTPTDLRHHRKATGLESDSGLLHLTLAYRPPFDWDGLLRYLESRAIPGVERIEHGVYRRTVQLGAEIGVITVSHNPNRGQLILAIPSDLSAHVLAITERVRSLFDLRADPMPIVQHLGHDEPLGGWVRANPGLRVPGAWSVYEIGIRAILGQQISLKAANTLAGRLTVRYGEPLRGQQHDGLSRLFPPPARLADASLRNIGLPRQRANTIRRFSRAVADGRLLLQSPTGLDDAIESLKAVPGIGSWTAHYIALRGLGEPDAFPAGDLGLRRAAAQAGQDALGENELRAMSDAWRPWRAYAALHLWNRYASSTSGEPSNGR